MLLLGVKHEYTVIMKRTSIIGSKHGETEGGLDAKAKKSNRQKQSPKPEVA